MIDVWTVVAGSCSIAVGLLIIVGALLNRFGVRTFISPPRLDQQPGLLPLGAGMVLLGVGSVMRVSIFWETVVALPAMTLLVIAIVLAVKSGPQRAGNGK